MDERKVKIGTDFSGVGAFDQALVRLGVDYETSFACDMDKYTRNTYLLNFGTLADIELLNTDEVKKIDDIYYRGFVNTKLNSPTEDELKFVDDNEERIARMFSFYYPWNVYKREIPQESLDEYVTTPPCQSFSIAGKRLGKDDKRGILFFNSLEFIENNRPKRFYFENVKGLLSDDKQDKKQEYGRTFQEWINYLGGKSINGIPTIFPYEDSVPYHIYFKVLNAKEHGVPQNRERVFIIGIRDDSDNLFSFPKTVHLEKRLKDILEENVDKKYFLSDTMLEWLTSHSEKSKEKGNGFNFKPCNTDLPSKAINARVFKMGVDDNYIEENRSHLLTPEGIGKNLRRSTGVIVTKNNSYDVIDLGEPKADPVIVHNIYGGFNEDEPRFFHDYSPAIRTSAGGGHLPSVIANKRIRRLTPMECFRLMDFNPEFKWNVSDTQAYKQAGNSIVVSCFVEILKKLNLN